MMQILSLGEMAREMANVANSFYMREQHVLEVAARHIQAAAQEMFGVYQPSVDAFAAWRELAPATKADRVRQGFTPNDPLLRSGRLRGTVEYIVHGREAYIGSRDPIMAYQEFGAVNLPARPVFGPALARSLPFLESVLGDALMDGGPGINFTLPPGYGARETALTL